eukprot:m.78520 g.78520  ORF g.78520 m.78520 type:complete len:93 (+) comp16238_c0_seq1:140-418(+)
MSSSDIGAASDDDLRTSAFKLAAEDPFDATTPKFKPELVQAICERTWDSKTRSSADALALTAEYMRYLSHCSSLIWIDSFCGFTNVALTITN